MPDTATRLTLISHATCPFVQRAAIALEEKGVPYERIDIDLKAKPDWFLRISPLGKVPLLRVAEGGKETVIFESSIICEYLEETQPGARLHPEDPLERARHRGWMEFGSQILGDLWKVQTATTEEEFEAARIGAHSRFERIEAELGDGPFFDGDRFSFVDAVFAPILRQIAAMDLITPTHLLDGFPKLTAWQAALSARPSVIATAPADYAAHIRRQMAERDGYLLKAAA